MSNSYPKSNKKGEAIFRVKCRHCRRQWKTKTPRSSLRDHWYDKHPLQLGDVEPLLEKPDDSWAE